MIVIIFRDKKTVEIPDHVVKCIFTEKWGNLLMSRFFHAVTIGGEKNILRFHLI